MQRIFVAATLLVCIAGTAGTAAAQLSDDVAATVRAAPRVAVGRVTAVHSAFSTNRFGDRVIVSRLTIATTQVFKGRVPAAFDMMVEGGTVGDLTLVVSDVPLLRAGDQAVFLLSGNGTGQIEPFDRARALLPVDAADRIKGTGVTLDQIRRLSLPTPLR
jgi:hypothetical protein